MDNDEEVLKIYRQNHPNATATVDDATSMHFAGGPGMHVHASFPCQHLSVARSSPEEHQVQGAIRNIRSFVETCATRGDVHSFSLETVCTSRTVGIARDLAESMHAVGYVVVEMKHCGVASARKRLIITTRMLANALRRDETLPLVGAKEAFSNAKLEVPVGTLYIKNHRGQGRNTFTRLLDPSATITSTALAFADAQWRTVRMLSPTDSAVLMGFPKDYALPTRQRDAQRAVGNAVPPPFAERVAKWALLAMQLKPLTVVIPRAPIRLNAIDREIAALKRERELLLTHN